jgi:hypothetical protein
LCPLPVPVAQVFIIPRELSFKMSLHRPDNV